jgi:transposase-like protein
MEQKQRSVEDLLQDLIIVQLALAGVGQHQIREIAGVDIHRVSRIAKLITKRKECRNGQG